MSFPKIENYLPVSEQAAPTACGSMEEVSLRMRLRQIEIDRLLRPPKRYAKSLADYATAGEVG